MNMIPLEWLDAMERDPGLKTFKLVGTDQRGRSGFVVKSRKVQPGAFHTVWVLPSGKIHECTNCPSRRVCAHKGRVAKRLLVERMGRTEAEKLIKASRDHWNEVARQEERDRGTVDSPTRGRSVLREEALIG